MQKKVITVCLSASAVFFLGNISADTLYVDNSNPSAYQVIQDAVDDAIPGDTIKVHAGTYMK